MTGKRLVKHSPALKVSLRVKLLLTGSMLALALLVVCAILFYVSTRTEQARAALGTNMGFENGLTEWTQVSGSWSLSSVSRTGTKSVKVTQGTGADGEIRNMFFTLNTPANGSNKIVVSAYANSSNTSGSLRLGVVDVATGKKILAPAYTSLSNAFTKVEAILDVPNGSTYQPVILAKQQGGSGSTNIYVDDVCMYLTTRNAPDDATPTSPFGIAITTAGKTVSLGWTNGTDAESGINGVTILRCNGATAASQAVNNQAVYSATNSLADPTSIGSWKVIYSGPMVSTFSDDPGSSGIYTYLIFMRDQACNYSASPARAIVFNGTGLSATLGSDVTLDGLYLPNGCTLTSGASATVTFRNGSISNVYGTLVDEGTFANDGGIVNMQNGSVYQYNKSSSYSRILSANWNTGSTLLMRGAFQSNNIPGLNQTFYNVTWNSPNQLQSQDIPTGFSAKGDLTFTNSGPGISSRVIWFSGTHHIGGNLFCNSSSDVRFKTGSHIIFDGTAPQTINIASGNHPNWNAITIDNPTVAKIMHAITVDSMICMKQGTFDMNKRDVSLANGCVVVRALGSYANGNYQPATAGAVYNLEYIRGGFATGNELTSSTTYLNNLIVNTPSNETIILDKTANVNGNLQLASGMIQTGTYEVYVRNSAASAVSYSNNSHVIGNLRRNVQSSGNWSYVYPIGTALNIECVQLDLHNLAGVSSIVGSFNSSITGAAPLCWVNGSKINTLLDHGFWTMTPNQQPTGGAYDITVRGKGYTNPASSESLYAIIKRSDATQAWKSQGTHSNNTQSMSGGIVTAKRSALSSFSDFAIGYGQNDLTITLTAFNVNLQPGRHVFITWSTSNEVNNAYFTIERSVNGTDFEMITEQEGAGTSTVAHQYAFTDEHPVNGTNYYRLRQVDFDGEATYGPVRQVTLTNTSTDNTTDPTLITVFPNPSNGVFTFSHVNTNGPYNGAKFEVFDMKGQLIFYRSFNDGESLQLDLSDKPNGTYVAKITDADANLVTKQIILQR